MNDGKEEEEVPEKSTKLAQKKKDTKRMIFEGVAAMSDTDLLRQTAEKMNK